MMHAKQDDAWSHPSWTTAIAVLAIGMTAAAARSEVIYLKDGTPLYGKVKREKEVLVDPASGKMVAVDKAGTSFLLNDGARFQAFSLRQVDRVDDATDVRGDHILLQMPFTRTSKQSRPTAAEVGVPGPISEKWERTVPVTLALDVPQMGGTEGLVLGPTPTRSQVKKINTSVKQKLTLLTPYAARFDAIDYDWTSYHLTDEFGPEVVLPLVRVHPDIAGKPGERPEFDRQFKVFRFCTQAGWLNEARAELNMLMQTFPGETQRLEAAGESLRRLDAQAMWEEAERSARCGRLYRAHELLAHLATAELPAPVQAEAANLKTRLDGQGERLAGAKRALTALASGEPALPPTIARAVAEMAAALNYDTAERLDTFVTLARQFEQDMRGGRPPKETREGVLAAAVTGWVLGASSAEASLAAAERLWSAREAVLTYQKTTNAADRKPIAERLERESGLAAAEVARLITLLPPPDAAEVGPVRPDSVLDRKTRNPWSPYPSYSYKLRLPAEYHSNRAYPALVVLPNAGESIDQAMAAWSPEAAKRGYILACVDWGGSNRSKYGHSLEEHFAATECTRDLRRIVQVDTDRVFLTGFGEGGNMAFDVGLSHPDEFAGVIPVNGRPIWFGWKLYWRNAQALPFYVVAGELSGLVRQNDSFFFENCSAKNYPMLYVLYRGRVTEFFPAEMPHAFDWMERKRRAAGFPELGRNPGVGYQGEEYQTVRATDNRFYWVSTEGPTKKFEVASVAESKPEVAATVQARIADGNQVLAYSRGLKQLSLWFGRVYDSSGAARDMIDFTKPVRIQLNNRAPWTNNNQPLAMSLDTLLEDLYKRGDRRRLFFARVDFNNLQ